MVQGHIGVEGNDWVEETAKEMAERTGTQRCPEQFTLLAHVKNTIGE